MAIKVASWNVEGRLTAYARGRRGTPARILQGIAAIDADVFVLPEAFLEKPANDVDDTLRSLGYKFYDMAYGEDDRDWSLEFEGKMPVLRVLSRLKVTAVEPVFLGKTRRLLAIKVIDPATEKEVRIIATHLDDRSESRRQLQVDAIVSYINNEDLPTVMLGDFNAMWGEGRALLFRSKAMRFAASHFPNAVLRDVAVRFTDMATGDVLVSLAKQTNLRDVDVRRRPTTTPKMRTSLFLPSVRLAQIDHIFVSPDIAASGFKIARDGGSDHRAVSATMTLR